MTKLLAWILDQPLVGYCFFCSGAPSSCKVHLRHPFPGKSSPLAIALSSIVYIYKFFTTYYIRNCQLKRSTYLKNPSVLREQLPTRNLSLMDAINPDEWAFVVVAPQCKWCKVLFILRSHSHPDSLVPFFDTASPPHHRLSQYLLSRQSAYRLEASSQGEKKESIVWWVSAVMLIFLGVQYVDIRSGYSVIALFYCLAFQAVSVA